MYSSSKIFLVIKSIRIRWAGHVACMGRGEAYTGFLVGKPKEKRPHGRSRRNREDNIMMDI